MLQALISVTERDGLGLRGDASLGLFAEALSRVGLDIEACREASASDVSAVGSTWTKRLGIPSRRPACVLRARKP